MNLSSRGYYMLVFLFLYIQSYKATSVESKNKICREENQPIASEELDDYLLVDVVVNSSITLDCKYW